MGVEYEHYLIPDEPLRRPSAERIARLVDTMEAEGWLLSPKSDTFRKMVGGGNFGRGAAHYGARKTGASYRDATSKGASAPWPIDAAWLRARKEALRLEWPLEGIFEIGARFPLTRAPYDREWVYFSYEIRWSRYVMEVTGENVRTRTPQCACGAQIAARSVEPFYSVYPTRCAACGAAWDPKTSMSRIEDIETGRAQSVSGGAFHRFALVVDCGKCVPEAGAEIRIDEELARMVERIIGCRFHQIGVVC